MSAGQDRICQVAVHHSRHIIRQGQIIANQKRFGPAI